MNNTPSHLPEKARKAICEALRAVLTDGLDLYTQLKVAHWNIKGPHFAALHPLFDTFATDQAANNDEVAERILTLGHLASLSARLDKRATSVTNDVHTVMDEAAATLRTTRLTLEESAETLRAGRVA